MSGCAHNWVHHSETSTTVTHRCTKCGDTYTSAKAGRADRPGRAYAIALLAMLVLCAAFIIWTGAPA